MTQHTTEFDALAWVRRRPETCDEDVTRKGESQPCEKPAVAVRIDPTWGTPYPVCAYHARSEMVPLADLLTRVTPPDVTEAQS